MFKKLYSICKQGLQSAANAAKRVYQFASSISAAISRKWRAFEIVQEDITVATVRAIGEVRRARSVSAVASWRLLLWNVFLLGLCTWMSEPLAMLAALSTLGYYAVVLLFVIIGLDIALPLLHIINRVIAAFPAQYRLAKATRVAVDKQCPLVIDFCRCEDVLIMFPSHVV